MKDAEAIILADANAATDSDIDGSPSTKIWFLVLQVVRGEIRDRELLLPGQLGYLGKSNDEDFRSARPGAYVGSCIAYDYQIGRKFLLFLNRTNGVWAVTGPPLRSERRSRFGRFAVAQNRQALCQDQFAEELRAGTIRVKEASVHSSPAD